jgi:hypothetical protein
MSNAPLVTREELETGTWAKCSCDMREHRCARTLLAFADLLERNHRCYKGDTGLGYCESCAALDDFGRSKEKK